MKKRICIMLRALPVMYLSNLCKCEGIYCTCLFMCPIQMCDNSEEVFSEVRLGRVWMMMKRPLAQEVLIVYILTNSQSSSTVAHSYPVHFIFSIASVSPHHLHTFHPANSGLTATLIHRLCSSQHLLLCVSLSAQRHRRAEHKTGRLNLTNYKYTKQL